MQHESEMLALAQEAAKIPLEEFLSEQFMADVLSSKVSQWKRHVRLRNKLLCPKHQGMDVKTFLDTYVLSDLIHELKLSKIEVTALTDLLERFGLQIGTVRLSPHTKSVLNQYRALRASKVTSEGSG